MYLKKVHIQNIKSIKDFEMDFEVPAGWHVLIGDNGSGKSTILKAIALGLIGRDDYGGINDEDWNSWLRFDAERSSIAVQLLPNEIDYRANGLPFDEALVDRLHTSEITLLRTESQSAAMDIEGTPFDRQSIKGWFSASFGPYRRFENGSGEWETVAKTRPRLAPHLSLFKSSATFPHTLAWIQRIYTESLENPSNTQITAIGKMLNSVGFLPDGTRFSEVSSKGIFFVNELGARIPLSGLSDGFRSVLSLTLELIHQLVWSFGPEKVFENIDSESFTIELPGIVIIDEIDVHLHPSWQLRIGEWLTKYFPQIQFIVTTHSPLICRASEKGSIWKLAALGSNAESGRIDSRDAERIIFGNILDAYGTEVFGKAVVRSQKSNEKLERLGRLNMLAAFGKISIEEEKERRELQLILTTDDPFGA